MCAPRRWPLVHKVWLSILKPATMAYCLCKAYPLQFSAHCVWHTLCYECALLPCTRVSVLRYTWLRFILLRMLHIERTVLPVACATLLHSLLQEPPS
jgi:hypothetical protein